jgi:hypothetical protein
LIAHFPKFFNMSARGRIFERPRNASRRDGTGNLHTHKRICLGKKIQQQDLPQADSRVASAAISGN